MSIRSAKRQIAKARMAAIGMDRINRRMRAKIRYCNGSIRRMQRTKKGRILLAEITAEDTPNWRRFLDGDLAKQADKALRRPKRKIRKIKDCSGTTATEERMRFQNYKYEKGFDGGRQ